VRRSILARKRLTAVFLVGLVLLYSPLIALFEGPVTFFGIPVLYFYLFGVWAAVIASAALVVGGVKE
jgi:hypothetical protein